MKAISLFSGVGGFDLGFERAGIETVLQVEIDAWKLGVLARHWPNVERIADVKDLRQAHATAQQGRCRDLDRESGRASAQSLREQRESHDGIDLIYGGFPCTDVSVAGKRAGLAGDASGLWFEFHRVLSELRPAWTVIENVPGLLSSNRGRDFATILGGLEELGYGWAYRILDARYFGVAQRRRRVFVVGHLGDSLGPAAVLAVCEGCGGDSTPSGQTGQGVAYSLAASARGTGDGHGQGWNTTYVIPVARSQTARNERLDGDSENFIVAGSLQASDGHHGHRSPRGDGSDNLIAAPLTAGGHPESNRPGRHREDDENLVPISGPFGVRRLTPLECERLMGWPDGWTEHTADGRSVPDSVRYAMCGDGVVSQVAEWIGRRLVHVQRALCLLTREAPTLAGPVEAGSTDPASAGAPRIGAEQGGDAL